MHIGDKVRWLTSTNGINSGRIETVNDRFVIIRTSSQHKFTVARHRVYSLNGKKNPEFDGAKNTQPLPHLRHHRKPNK